VVGKSVRPKVTSSLLASAQEFLGESLRDYTAGKLNFAIVHAVTATELVLKERLARVNSALILRNIDAKVPRKEQTVSLGALPQRLENLGMPLTPEDARLIADITGWRHQIVHHMPAFDAQAAQQQLPQLLDFLAGYLRTELATPLETFLPSDLYRDADRLLSDWQKAVAAAQARAIAEGNVLTEICTQCRGSKVLCLREDDMVHCHLCGAKLIRCDCDACGRKTLVLSTQIEGGNFCDECIEAAGDAWIQIETESRLGK
jgi:hypothetical protein